MVYPLSFRVIYFDLFHLFQRFRLAPQPGNATIMPRQLQGVPPRLFPRGNAGVIGRGRTGAGTAPI